MTAPFVIDLGFNPQTTMPPSSRASDLPRPLIGGFRRPASWRGAISLPVSLWIGGVLQAGRQSVVLLAGHCRRQPMGAGIRDYGGEFHQRPSAP